MKTLLFSTYDIVGGGAVASYRVHTGLRQLGVDSRMVVAHKASDDSSVVKANATSGLLKNRLMRKLDILPSKLYRERSNALFSSAYIPDGNAARIASFDPDIVHLGWTAYGFFRIETLKSIRKPIVWTLHDMWAFTGGCHYDEGCGRYEDKCGKCPLLGSRSERDLSRWVWNRKNRAWRHKNFTMVTPSRWLASCARESGLFKDVRVEVIPNGLDLHVFKPADRNTARELLNLPKDKQLILFGAVRSTAEPRKGFQLLRPAVRSLAESGWGQKVELVVFGASEPENPADFGVRANYIGHLRDEISLSLLYSAADVFVAPSLQDNLPNTVLEAMACGTPCIAFDTGGLPDMIEHEITGYLARPYEPEELSEGIAWVLQDNERLGILSMNARQKVEDEFELGAIARRYFELYGDLLNNG